MPPYCPGAVRRLGGFSRGHFFNDAGLLPGLLVPESSGAILRVMKFIDPADAIRVSRPVVSTHNEAAKHRAEFQQCPCISCEQSSACRPECDRFRRYVSGDTEPVTG